jgi:glycosyltransferase involved in cell wall biosynthesis
MKNSMVSVVLPCHGSLPYMKETVDSLIHQSFPDFEVIVVNDRIAAEHLEFIHGLHKIDPRFKVVKSRGLGISAALNTGIELAKSNLISRIDADDTMDPQRLEFQLDRISISKDILCVGTQLKIIDEFGKLVRYTRFPESSNQIREMMKIRNVVAHPSVMFRKEAVLMAGSYRSFFDGAEDYDLWLRLMKFGEIINIHEPLTSYRIHASQETRRNREYQQEMDSITRFYALEESLTPNALKGNNLKSIVRFGNFRLTNLLKESTLSHQMRISLLSSHYLNAAMSHPNFGNLLRALFVLTIRPKLFFLAFRYSFSR